MTTTAFPIPHDIRNLGRTDAARGRSWAIHNARALRRDVATMPDAAWWLRRAIAYGIVYRGWTDRPDTAGLHVCAGCR